MITQIIWLLSWPLLIALSYFTINWALKKYETNSTGIHQEDTLK